MVWCGANFDILINLSVTRECNRQTDERTDGRSRKECHTIGVARILSGGALFGQKKLSTFLVVTPERRSKYLILYLQI